jgi:hypothetical protein
MYRTIVANNPLHSSFYVNIVKPVGDIGANKSVTEEYELDDMEQIRGAWAKDNRPN